MVSDNHYSDFYPSSIPSFLEDVNFEAAHPKFNFVIEAALCSIGEVHGVVLSKIGLQEFRIRC